MTRRSRAARWLQSMESRLLSGELPARDVRTAPSPAGPSGPLFTAPSVPRKDDVGRALAAFGELLERCTTAEADPASLAFAAAWQHAALAQITAPHPVDLPLLEELAGPGQLVSRLAAMSASWTHLQDHLPALHRMLGSLPPWARLTDTVPEELMREFVGCTAAGRGVWLDPAGWIKSALTHPSALFRGTVRLCFYTPPPSATGVPGRPYPKSGDSVIDESCGSGYMLASSAAWLRGHGWDPHTCSFFGMDTDADNLAIASINLVGAGAGPHVWLHQGDPHVCKFVDPNGDDVDHDVFVTDPISPETAQARWLDALVLANVRPRPVVVDAQQRAVAWRRNPPRRKESGQPA